MKAKGIYALGLGALLVLSGCSVLTAPQKECAHVWGTWIEESAATCTQNGIERRVCSKCGREEKQEISAKGHKWGTWTEEKTPTCTQTGSEERKCEICGQTETRETEALGHAEGVYRSDEEGHWKVCPVCETPLSEKEAHKSENGACSVCGEEIVGLEYAVYENECHVIGPGTETGDIVIPAYRFGKPVTEIGEIAFSYKSITSVVIPDTVVYIRRAAFNFCTKLKSVTFGANVKEIGEKAFLHNTAMTEIKLNKTVAKIGPNAFQGCKEVAGVLEIPDSVTEIGEAAFDSCDKLQEMKVGKGIKELPYMFSLDNKALVSVSFSDGLETIGRAAFSGCKALKTVSFPSTLRTIGKDAFDNTALQKLVLPDSVKTIGEDAFDRCGQLESVEIGDGVTDIGEKAFARCSQLKTIFLGKSVAAIGPNAFFCDSGWTGFEPPHDEQLESITVDPANKTYYSKEGILYDRATNTILKVPRAIKGVVHIADGVTAIDNREQSLGSGHDISSEMLSDYFEHRPNVTEIILPESVKTIAAGAFSHCDSLVKISIPRGVEKLANNLFSYCPQLATVTYGGSREEWLALTKGLKLFWDDLQDVRFTVVCLNGNLDPSGKEI